MQAGKDMQMISHDLIENITNYILVLLLIGTSLLVRFGDILTFLLNKAFKPLHLRVRGYPVKRITNIQ